MWIKLSDCESEDQSRKCFNLDKTQQNFLVGDFLLVTVLYNKFEKNFPSQAANVEQNCIKIKFMLECRGHLDTFVFTNVGIISDIAKDNKLMLTVEIL